MAIVLYVLLRGLHFIHSLVAFFFALRLRFFVSLPLSLSATRRRTPRHLALIVVSNPHDGRKLTQDYLLETTKRLVTWCSAANIEKCTVYDYEDLLSDSVHEIAPSALAHDTDSDSDTQYPLTPPPSEHSESRPLSPQNDGNVCAVTIRIPGSPRQRRLSKSGLRERHASRCSARPLTLCIASRQCSKPALAIAAVSLARQQKKTGQPSDVTVEALTSVLEGPGSVTAPDFLIVYHLKPSPLNQPPLELHSFPPWQIRLTEIYHCCKRRSLLRRVWNLIMRRAGESGSQLMSELDLRAALDEYADAEMRFGR